MSATLFALPTPEPIDPTRAYPAGVAFPEYWENLVWGAPDENGRRHANMKMLRALPPTYRITSRPNEYATMDDKYSSWDASLKAGRSYLVGNDVPMSDFIRAHISSLNEWQKAAFTWCLANPKLKLMLESGPLRRSYVIQARGEYIQIGLPHQDMGGERHWISQDGKKRVLVNVD